MSAPTALPGADDWEYNQLRQRQLPIAKVLPLSADGKTTAPTRPHDEPEPWEDDLLEKWSSMQVRGSTVRACPRVASLTRAAGGSASPVCHNAQIRLESQLRSNPLDYENKPFSDKGLVDGVVDGKTTDGTCVNIKWIPPPGENNTKQNSDHLMMCVARRSFHHRHRP
jgi:hypothetical protein